MLLRVNTPPVLHLIRGPLIALFPPPPPDTTLTLLLEGANEEVTYDIEASTDMVTWTKLDLFPMPPPRASWIFNLSVPANAHQFYRAVAR